MPTNDTVVEVPVLRAMELGVIDKLVNAVGVANVPPQPDSRAKEDERLSGKRMRAREVIAP